MTNAKSSEESQGSWKKGLGLGNFRERLARADLEYYSEWMGFLNERFHREWYGLVIDRNIRKLLIEGPRSHAKTQCLSINFTSWLIGRDRNTRVLLISNTGTQASALVRQIRLQAEGDQQYQKIFGRLSENAALWNDSALQVKRTRILKDPTVSGLGVLGPIIGKRADLIVCDDVVDLENSATKGQRDKLEVWFKQVLLPVLEPEGKIIVIGSSYHYDDLYSRLEKDADGGWLVKKYKAIQPDGGALWPSRWPLVKLEERKREMGTILFNAQYMCEPTGMKGYLLRDEWLNSWDKEPAKGLEIYAGIDPALGEGDLQAIATIAYDRAINQAYLVEVWADAVPFPDFIRKIVKQNETYRYTRIYLETNAFQKALIYQKELSGLPLTESNTDTNKERRFISMSSHFEAKRILVNPVLLRGSEFKSEWLQFPKGQYDDALDAVDIALRNIIVAGVDSGFVLGPPIRRF